MKLAPTMTAVIRTNRPRITRVTIIGVRFPLTGPMFGASRASPEAPDIWSALGGVSPAATSPEAVRPAVSDGVGSGLSEVHV